MIFRQNVLKVEEHQRAFFETQCCAIPETSMEVLQHLANLYLFERLGEKAGARYSDGDGEGGFMLVLLSTQ